MASDIGEKFANLSQTKFALRPNMRMQPTPFRRRDRADIPCYHAMKALPSESAARMMRQALGGHKRPIRVKVSA